MAKCVCIVGQDARQCAAGQVLRRAGYRVTDPSGAGQAEYLLLPMSQSRVGDELARCLQAARPGTVVLAGRPGAPVRAAVRQAYLPLIDYFERPELECLNAVPTAEGCLQLLLRLRQYTVWESEFLVLGYGRIGAAVAQRLLALGGRVTVAARRAEQLAYARCAGCGTIPLARVEQILPRQTTLINTIPAPILPRSRLALLPPGALVLDLASLPGGTDFTAAHELGLQAEHALALPGKCAPKTAGLLIGQTVLALLQERSDPHDKT